MESTSNTEKKAEQEVIKDGTRTSSKLDVFIPVYIPAIEKGLIDHNNQQKRVLDILKAKPSKHWLTGPQSPILTPRTSLTPRTPRTPRTQDPNSANAGNVVPPRRRFRVPFVRKLSWTAILRYGKNWIRQPTNMALLLWLIFVGAGLFILGLVMSGLLDSAIPDKHVRTRWTEIVNQILNALFTIMCLYQHPRIAHHLVILCRWCPKDVVELRMMYCKTMANRANERAHLAFVIVLLHLTCFAQYFLCALSWGWTTDDRPDWAVNLCIGLGIVFPVIAFLYTVYSPLGRKITLESSSTMTDIRNDKFQKHSLEVDIETGGVKLLMVAEPEWLGGPFDCCDDPAVAYLSFFCTFCVFGWNMERLGFGNMYVHIVTFILFCIAPLSVFYISTLKISDDPVKYLVGITGCVLCFCGLLYGGFWRIQMRKKFKLPANPLCFGYPAVTDCFQWLFCWSCSLAQEVRTGNFYEIEADSFYRRSLEQEAVKLAALEPLPREGKSGQVSMEGTREPVVVYLSNLTDTDMSAPIPPSIEICDEPREGGGFSA